MKIFKFIFLLLLLSQFAHSQNQKIDSIEFVEYFLNGKVKADFWVKVFNSDTLLDGEYIGYYENGKIFEKTTWEKGRIVGVREFYDKKGRVIFKYIYIDGEFPRTIISQAFYYEFLTACKTSIGQLIETGLGPMDYQHNGYVIYVRGNGNLMDSLFFDHGNQVYRAHFNNRGKLSYEEKY